MKEGEDSSCMLHNSSCGRVVFTRVAVLGRKGLVFEPRARPRQSVGDPLRWFSSGFLSQGCSRSSGLNLKMLKMEHLKRSL